MFLPVIMIILSYIFNSFLYMGQFLYEITPYQDQVIEQNKVDSFAVSCINVLALSISRHTDYFLNSVVRSNVLSINSEEEGMKCDITEPLKEGAKSIKFKILISSVNRIFVYRVLFTFIAEEDGSYLIENILINN